MHVDLFIGMYTIQRMGDIVVRMCGSWEKNLGRSAQVQVHFEASETVRFAHFCLFAP